MTLLFLPITPLADGEALGFTVSCERFGSRRSPMLPLRLGARRISSARLERSQLAIVSLQGERSMRALTSKGGQMATPTPLTARVVAAISDARERARVVFLADARIDAQEQLALVAIDNALTAAEQADLARRTARAFEDTGELTAWQQRQWREMARDHNGPRAA